MTGSRGMLAAKQPLVVPMLLRLSHFKLNSYVVLVVSKQKGITLVFKTDPLQNVDINSTFDSIAVIQKYIQREIEGQLRQMFREDLPGIIHRLSQQWVKTKIEAPYLHKNPPPVSKQQVFETRSVADISTRSMPSTPLESSIPPTHPRRPPSLASIRSYSFPNRPRSTSGYSSLKPKHPQPSTAPSESVSSHDLDNFDPTYGLRPEGLPTKSSFRGFSSLFGPNKGLADLTEDSEEDVEYDDDDDGAASFDIVNWEYTAPESIPDHTSVMPESEYETIPAVGGGTITRPRIYHSQSMIQPSFGAIDSSSKQKSSHSGSLAPPRSGFTTPGLVSQLSSGGYFGMQTPQIVAAGFRTAPPFSSRPGRSVTPDSLETQLSRSSSGRGPMSTPPTEHITHETDYKDHYSDALHHDIVSAQRLSAISASVSSSRRPSVSSMTNLDATFPYSSTSPSNAASTFASPHNPNIVLRPSLNNTIHQLATLSFSNHTLSPYTRSLQHFTVRSVPPRSAPPTAAFDRQFIKAKRKRTFRLNANVERARPVESDDTTQHEENMGNGEDFDVSDMDRYFKRHDDHDFEREDATHSDLPYTRPPSHLRHLNVDAKASS